MQVNKINNTNFGMALKIDKGLQSELRAKPEEFIKTLDRLGERIADIKTYHVCFEEGMGFDNPIIRSAKTGRKVDYLAGLRHEETKLGQYYEFPMGMAGESVGGFYPDEPFAFRDLYGKNAAKEYKKFKTLDKYNQAAEYTNILEQAEIKRARQEAKNNSEKRINEAIQKERQAQHERNVDEILNKYQNDIARDAKDDKSQKRGLFGRLINFFK